MKVTELKVGRKYIFRGLKDKEETGVLKYIEVQRPQVHMMEGIEIDICEGYSHELRFKMPDGSNRFVGVTKESNGETDIRSVRKSKN